MLAANSAAQVSTMWYTGRIPRSWRSRRTRASVVPRIWASWASENPAAFAARSEAALSSGDWPRVIRSACSSMPLIWSMNQASMPVAATRSATLAPARMAWCTVVSRPSCGSAQRASRSAWPAGGCCQLNGAPACSSERSAFCSASGKLRPMAIASPTDFMCVVSTGSAPGNFSKANRGTLTTT